QGSVHWRPWKRAAVCGPQCQLIGSCDNPPVGKLSMNVYLADGLRSPIGKFGGSLNSLRASEIGTVVATALLERHHVPVTAVERIIAGMVLQDMTESNPARIVGMRLGIPDRPAFTVNM